MMSTKGSAAMTVMVCRPLSASVPPTRSMTAATAPVATPQKITVGRLGWMVPRSDGRAHHDRGGIGAGDEEDARQDHHDDAPDTVASG